MTKIERHDFYRVIEELENEFLETGEDVCARCPYRDQCEKEELYWGCGVWETQMGDDL